MKVYTKLISIFLILILTCNAIWASCNNYYFPDLLLWIFIAILICGLSSGIITILSHIFPEKWYSPYRKRFKVSKKENKFYIKLKIKKWKDKVPELGKLGGFSKSKIENAKNPQYIFKFLTETCIAESLHFFSILSGILVFFFLPKEYLLIIALPIFILNTILHLLPIIIQRYIRPKFLKIYNHILQYEENNNIDNALANENTN